MALFQYASEFAHDSLSWAVAEGQKCFNAPLDHTRPHPIEPFPELINAPTGNPYFDRLLKSETGLRFLELSDPQTGKMTSAGEESMVEPSDAKSNAMVEPSSNLSVVVLREDGTHTTCKHALTNVASEDPGKEASLDDTLTKRSSPSAVSEAVQSVLLQLAASRIDIESSLENNVSEQHVQLEATFSDSDDEPEKPPYAKVKEGTEINLYREIIICQVEPIASDQFTREDVAEQSVAPRTTIPDEVNIWNVGSVLEVFSASANAWFPGLVTQIVVAEGELEMLTVQFWPSIDDSKQKTACRDSTQFAPIGAHCGDRLPPGFELVFSKSRPGVFVFLDATTGLKYDSLELTWAVHFQRWLDRPASVGLETISSVVPPVAIGPTTKQVSGAEACEFGLATQVVPPGENLSVPCCQEVSATFAGITEEKTCEHDQALHPAALFLEAMAFESPGEFSSVSRATLEAAEKPEGQDVLTEELLTDEFFASLPEPCESPSKQRNLTNMFSSSGVSATVL